VLDRAFIHWETPSSEAVLIGYLVYRKHYTHDDFTLIDTVDKHETSYSEILPDHGTYTYKIYALYLDESHFSSALLTIHIDKVSPVTFAPEIGYFTTAIAVEMISLTPDAYIYFTTDGSIPSEHSTLYTQPIIVELDTTIVISAIAMKAGAIPSVIKTATYHITGKLSPPTFLHSAGIFYDFIEVGFIEDRHNAQIRYTIDGTEVDEHSPLYTEPLYLRENVSVRARAFKEHWIASYETYHQYIVPNIPRDVKVNCAADSIYISWQPPSLLINEYHRNENDHKDFIGYHVFLKHDDMTEFTRVTPAPISETYFTFIRSDWTKTYICILAVYEDDIFTSFDARSVTSNASEIVDFEIVRVSPAYIYPPPGRYYDAQHITMTHDYAKIYYTLDGTTPTTSSHLYQRPIALNNHTDTTIRYRAYFECFFPSDVYSATYLITDSVKPPLFSYPTGSYNTALRLEMYYQTPGSTIFYTLNGTEPDSTSRRYTQPIYITENTTLRATALRTDWRPSIITTAHYELDIPVSDEPVAQTPPEIEDFVSRPFPNPFHTTTEISFVLSQRSLVEIEIYNLLGQRVITLVSRYLDAGRHSVSWNGRNMQRVEVAKGVYFCHIKINDTRQMVKLIYTN
jgi:hypothetical protein